MTIEAALVIPVFMVSMLFFLRFYEFIYLNNEVQKKLNDTAKEISNYQYANSHLKVLKNSDKFQDLDSNLVQYGVSTTYLSVRLNDTEAVTYLKSIDKNSLGIRVLESKLSETGVNDLKAVYICPFPIFGKKVPVIGGNRCYFRSWIGESLTEKKDLHRQTVYITRTGSVYHVSKDCTYIRRMIKEVSYENVKSCRNISGGKYYACRYCVKGNHLKGESCIYY